MGKLGPVIGEKVVTIGEKTFVRPVRGKTPIKDMADNWGAVKMALCHECAESFEGMSDVAKAVVKKKCMEKGGGADAAAAWVSGRKDPEAAVTVIKQLLASHPETYGKLRDAVLTPDIMHAKARLGKNVRSPAARSPAANGTKTKNKRA